MRWILSLGLSHPIKNARRDFSNGYVVAEILHKYYPQDVALHSFDNGATSEKRKVDNWRQLEKICKKKGLRLSAKDVEGVIACKEEALIPVLERVYKKVTTTSSPAEKRDASSSSSSQRGEVARATGYASKLGGVQSSQAQRPAAEVPVPVRPIAPRPHHVMQPEPSHYIDGDAGLSQQQPYLSSPFRIEPMREHGFYPSDQGVGVSPRRLDAHAHAALDGYASPAASQQRHWDPFEFGRYAYEDGGAPVVATVVADHCTPPGSYLEGYAAMGSPPSYAQDQERVDYGEDDYVAPPTRYLLPNHSPGNDSYQHRLQHQPYPTVAGKENQGSPKFAMKAQVRDPPSGYASAMAGAVSVAKEAEGFALKQGKRRIPKQAGLKGAKYWELGKLGPDLERKEIVEKRSARDRMREFSSEIRRNNARVTRKSAKAPKEDRATMDAAKAYSARQRALDFAKNIPKPAHQQRASTSPSKASKGSGGLDNVSELDRLMEQHEAQSQQINSMRHQLERQLKLASI